MNVLTTPRTGTLTSATLFALEPNCGRLPRVVAYSCVPYGLYGLLSASEIGHDVFDHQASTLTTGVPSSIEPIPAARSQPCRLNTSNTAGTESAAHDTRSPPDVWGSQSNCRMALLNSGA